MGTSATSEMRSVVLLALAPLAMGFAPAFAPGSVRPQAAVAKAPALSPLRTQRSAVVGLQMGKGIEFPAVDATDMRIGLVTTRWNTEVVSKLKSGARQTLLDAGIAEDDIVEFEVPGAWELPLASRYMAMTQKVYAIIPMGVLIKGDTDHYDMIKDAATAGLMDLQLTTGVPVLCGILGCHTMEQAEERATGDFNHGVRWARLRARNQWVSGLSQRKTWRNLQASKTARSRERDSSEKISAVLSGRSPGRGDR